MSKAAELAKWGEVSTNGQVSGRRNALINGQMQVWQRATAFASIANGLTYTADRWVAFVGASEAQAQVNQDTSVPEGFKYSLEFGRAANETDHAFQYVCQLLETQDSLQFANKTVTFSFYAKAGAHFSAASSNINVKISSGTGTDETSATFSGGPATGFTGNAVIVNATQAITTTWTRYTFTGTVAATAKQIAVAIGYDPVGTAGADDNFYMTGLQLEVGSVATPFEHRSFGEELALCQRYYQKISGASGATHKRFARGHNISTTLNESNVYLSTEMRIFPALETTGTAANYAIYHAGSVTTANGLPALNSASDAGVGNSMAVQTTVGSGLTTGQEAALLGNNTVAAFLAFDSEL